MTARCRKAAAAAKRNGPTLFWAIPALLALAACEGDAAMGRQSAIGVPEWIQRKVAAFVPADGRIHLSHSGQFKIDSHTRDCVLAPHIDPALKNYFDRFYGVGPGIHVRAGEKSADGRICRDDGTGQVSYLSLKLAGSGRPYRLTLAVWQGDASWVGTVERADGNFHPKARFARPIEGGKIPQSEIIKGSVTADIHDLSSNFTSFLDGDAK